MVLSTLPLTVSNYRREIKYFILQILNAKGDQTLDDAINDGTN